MLVVAQHVPRHLPGQASGGGDEALGVLGEHRRAAIDGTISEQVQVHAAPRARYRGVTKKAYGATPMMRDEAAFMPILPGCLRLPVP